MKIAHVSDLHFSKFCFSPLQFLSKRWLGSANMLAGRQRTYVNKKPFTLPDLLKEEGVTHVLITGDLTTTSRSSEFLMAKKLTSELEKRGMTLFILPGNHDRYTRRSDTKKTFYDHFPMGQFRDKRVVSLPLNDGWHLVMLDTAVSTSIFQSSGLYTDEIDDNLRKTLQSLPKDAPVLLANHFPFFQHEKSKRRMHGGEKLEKLIREFPQIKLYAHGHTHRRCLADLRNDGLPLIIDSGSASHRKRASFNIIDLGKDPLTVQAFVSEDPCGDTWQIRQTLELV